MKTDKSLKALGETLSKNPDLEIQLKDMASHIDELTKRADSDPTIILRKIKAILKARRRKEILQAQGGTHES